MKLERRVRSPARLAAFARRTPGGWAGPTDPSETGDPVPILLPRQVVDVAKLMKAYISMIVKKRYSTSRSISSQGSSR